MPYRHRFDGIVFDLDGTLIETAPDLAAALNHVMARAGLPAVPLADVRHMVGDGARMLIERGFAANDQPLAAAELDRWFGVFLDYYGEHIADESHAFDGVLAVLDELQAAGLTLGVCTNKPEAMSRRLFEALGLADRFSTLLGGDSLPMRKPDPGHLLGTLERMGVAPGRAAMIGDSANDRDAARNAGVPVVLVTFGYTTIPALQLEADAHIDRFAQLPAALAALA
tara:strand:+ start:199 stop:876 length:678 start_codon:yes stop_codon:yes gene_type:complete